jgi:hypothetical protein
MARKFFTKCVFSLCIPAFVEIAAHIAFYPSNIKLPEHLKSYFKKWSDYTNERNTTALNKEASDRITALLKARLPGPPAIILTLPPKPLGELLANSPATRPVADSPPCKAAKSASAPDHWQMQKLLADHRLLQSATQFDYADHSRAESQRAGPSSSHCAAAQKMTEKSNKRKAVDDGRGKTRKERSCRRCQSTKCQGRWNIENCHLKSRVRVVVALLLVVSFLTDAR